MYFFFQQFYPKIGKVGKSANIASQVLKKQFFSPWALTSYITNHIWQTSTEIHKNSFNQYFAFLESSKLPYLQVSNNIGLYHFLIKHVVKNRKNHENLRKSADSGAFHNNAINSKILRFSWYFGQNNVISAF